MVHAATLAPIVVQDQIEGVGVPSASKSIVPLQNSQLRSQSLSEVVAEQAGVHVTRYGGLEQASGVSIRGSDPDEVRVSLDGIPIDNALGRGVDLSLFPTSLFDTIEVDRGTSHLMTGESSTAGGIALTTRKMLAPQTFQSSFGYGSFDTVKGNVLYGNNQTKFHILGGVDFLNTKGDFKFLDDHGTPLNSADDKTVSRQNNQALQVAPLIKFSYPINPLTQLHVLFYGHYRDAGVPGMTSNQSSEANLNTVHLMGSVRLTREAFLLENLNFSFLSSVSTDKSQFDDPKAEIGLGGVQKTDDDFLSLNEQINLSWELSDHTVTLKTLYRFEDFRPQSLLAGASAGSTSYRHTVTPSLGDVWKLFDEKLIVSGGGAIETVSNHLEIKDPSVASSTAGSQNTSDLNYSLYGGALYSLTDFFKVKGNLARGIRFPYFSELFGDRGTVVGNSQLKTESSVNWDAGIVVQKTDNEEDFINHAEAGATYFERHVSDLIQYEQASGYARAENVGKALFRGVEVSAKGDFFSHFLLVANYTWLLARDQAQYEGKIIPGRPRHEWLVKGSGHIKKGELFAELQGLSENYLDPLNTRFVSGRTIVSAGALYRPMQQLTFSLEGKNLTDNRIEDVLGFPLPGRSVFVTASLGL